MKLSYLITVHNETDTLIRLLEKLVNNRFKDDEIVILDDFSDNDNTRRILTEVETLPNVSVHQHKLDNDYGTHKNYGTTKCTGDWIFQIDGDENPSDVLIFHI